jgi:DNA-binding NarL/FixJ family response regulator
MSATILIVDDHDLLRQALQEWLRIKFPGCHVIEATSGEEAIALAQVNLPHVVIMDLDLPGMSGLQATMRLKKIVPTTQVLVLTLYDDEVHRASAAIVGVNAYVPKHKMSSELQPVLAALLSSISASMEYDNEDRH